VLRKEQCLGTLKVEKRAGRKQVEGRGSGRRLGRGSEGGSVLYGKGRRQARQKSGAMAGEVAGVRGEKAW